MKSRKACYILVPRSATVQERKSATVYASLDAAWRAKTPECGRTIRTTRALTIVQQAAQQGR